MKTRILHSVLSSIVFFASVAAQAVDLARVEKELRGEGCVGWIHASVSDRQLYVFTYRNPSNFFDYVEMSLVACTPEISQALAQNLRHDQVRIQGKFLDNLFAEPVLKLR